MVFVDLTKIFDSINRGRSYPDLGVLPTSSPTSDYSVLSARVVSRFVDLQYTEDCAIVAHSAK